MRRPSCRLPSRVKWTLSLLCQRLAFTSAAGNRASRSMKASAPLSYLIRWLKSSNS